MGYPLAAFILGFVVLAISRLIMPFV